MYTKPNNPRNVIDILTVVNRKVSNTLLPDTLVEAGDSQRKRVKTFDPKETSTPPTTGFAGKSKSEKVYHYYQVPSFESSLIKKLFLKIPVNKLVQPPAPQPASADADAQ
uniref:Uncharacterized protein n=2 Tax=Ciona intestinalis TaxID=7719 RepID=H2XRF9_CIOIN